jgi:hypothetical protein
MKIVNLQIYHQDTNVFMGESLELCINSNNAEISKTPIEFWGNTYDEVVAQVKTYAKAKFGKGIIKIINARSK